MIRISRKYIACFLTLMILVKTSDTAWGALYAELLHERDGYRYKTISNMKNDNLTVNLSEMEPIKIRNTSGCFNLVFGLIGSCKNSSDFYKSRLDFKRSIGLWIGTAMILPAVTLFGLSGKNDVFDRSAFDNANKEALENLKPSKEELIKMAQDYDDHVRKIEQQFIKSQQGESAKIFSKYSQNYETDSHDISYKINIVDQSGFHKNSITPSKIQALLSINKSKLPEFEKRGINYTDSIIATPNKYKEMLSGALEKANITHDNDMVSLRNELAQYESDLTKTTSSVRLSYPSQTTIDNYNITINTPSEIIVSHGKTSEVPVSVMITSKYYGLLLPEYDKSDQNIEINTTAKTITLYNKTKNYIDIKGISTYYNNDVFSTTFNNPIELPPETHKTLDNINKYVSTTIIDQAIYKNLTANEAAKINFKYGFAVKYRIVEQNIDRTLYDIPVYNLLKVISSL